MTLVQKDYSKSGLELCDSQHEMRTSDVYKTENLPYRFEYPSRWNYGNCVFTTSERVVQKPDHGAKVSHPFFRTTNSEYGSKPPCIHTMPHTYYPRSHKYWEHLASVGMYRNCSFNTSIDRNPV